MHTAKRTITATILTLATIGWAATAQANELKLQRHLVELGVYAGAFFPSDKHELYDFAGGVPYQAFKDVVPEVGLRLAYLPIPWFGIEAEGGIMPTTTATTSESSNLYHFRGHLLVQYPGAVVPFLLAGAGLLGVESGSRAVGDDMDVAGHWGGGLKFYPINWLALRVDGRHSITKGLGDNKLAHHFEVLGGLSFVIGWSSTEGPADSDQDGVPDDRDRCPEQAANTADGCPLRDSDGDGVPDAEDKCPNLAATTADGCPLSDSDGDGVPNETDKCPEQAASTPDGCPLPDLDGDGVPDQKDECPNKAAATPNGCPPDADGDGIVDEQDKCVNEPETRNGFQDEDGCPDVLPKAVKRFTGTIGGIYFSLGSARIRSRSHRTLDRAVKVLNEYLELKLKIRGHTDSSGSRTFNMELSLQRASAVKAYLVEKGVAPERLSVEGVGPDEPVSNNKTREGRAENRRIEFRLAGAK